MTRDPGRTANQRSIPGKGAGLVALAVAVCFGAGPGVATAFGQESGAAAASADAVVEAARRELAADRAAEAENLLRDALRNGWSARVGVELAGILVERARALSGTSDLIRSLREGAIAEAESLFERAAGEELVGDDAAIGRANCLVLRERIDEADRMLGERLAALRREPAGGGSRARIASVLIAFLSDQGRFDAARTQVLDSGRNGDFDEARRAYELLVVDAAAHAPERIGADAEAALKAGAKTFDVAYVCWDGVGESQLEKLLHLYSRLLAVRPLDPALLFYRGVVRRRMGDVDGALADLKPGLDDAEVGARAKLQYGDALIQAGRAEEALPIFEALAAAGGDSGVEVRNGILGVAVARARARRFADALSLYREVLTRDPTNEYARIGEPLCLRYLGDYAAASAAYERGIEARPDDPQLLNDYALMLRAHGERVRAREMFERALGAGSADAGENLGIIAFRDDRDPELARRYFARTMLIDPKRPRVRFYRELCNSAASAKGAK